MQATCLSQNSDGAENGTEPMKKAFIYRLYNKQKKEVE